MLFKYAWLEIKNQKKFVFLFVFNIVIGLLGPIFVENFKGVFSSLIESKSKLLLGGDLSVSSRLDIDPEIIAGLKKDLDSSDVIEKTSIFTMVKGEGPPRLVNIQTLSPQFPFYGNIELEDGRQWPFKDQEFNNGGSVFVYPELKLQLGVEIGDFLQIGKVKLKVAGFIKNDAGQIFQSTAMAPKAYISSVAMKESDLIQKGSTKRVKYIFRSKLPEEKIKEIKDQWNKKITTSGIRLRTASESGDNIGRVVNYLNDFLGLVSLVAIFLSSLGLFYLYSNFLSSKQKDMDILHCIGLKGKQIFKLYYFHIFILGAIGIVLSSLIALSLFPILGKQLESVFTFSPSSWLNFQGVGLALLIGFIGTPLLVFPLLYPLIHYRPDGLFQSGSGKENKFQIKRVWTFLPFFVFCYLLSLYFSNSILIGTGFFLIFFLISGILYPLFYYLVGKAEVLEPKTLYISLGLKYFSRFKKMSSLILVSLLMGSLLVMLIPQLEHGLQGELSTKDKKDLPSLFLFDIQPEQVDEVKEFLAENKTAMLSLSPMIRGRIKKVNNKEFQKEDEQNNFMESREDERARRFRSRGINVSYRDGLGRGEKIIAGKDFSGDYKEGIPEVSLEKRYAKRMGLKIGDEIEFEFFSMPVQGKVISLRAVKWTTFLPNFFIQFQPGVLEDAPKIFLGAVPSLEDGERIELQEKLFNKFPNISVIDISQLVEKITGFLGQMGLALKAMAMMTFLAGIMVLFSITQHQLKKRQKDILHLKILGIPSRTLQKMIFLEFSLLGFIGSSIGAVLCLIASFIVSNTLFDGIWELDWLRIAGPVILITALCLFLSYTASRSVLKQRPEAILGDGIS